MPNVENIKKKGIKEEKMNDNTKTVKKNALYFIFLLVILACYNSVFLTQYGFSDDWAYIYGSAHDPFELLKWDILTGRPSYGIIRWLFSFMVGSVAALSALRLISVVTLFILCIFIYKFITERNIFSNMLQRAIFSLLICMLPSFQVYAAWTICFPFITSVILAGLSYKLLSENNSIKCAIAALLLLIISFSIYQPTAMCFVFFAFLDLVIAKDKIKPGNFFRPAVVLFLGMAAAFLMAKALPFLLFGEVTTRTAISFDIISKIKWFVTEPLINAICNFDLGKKAFYLTVSTLIVLYGIYSLSKENNKKYLLLYVILFALSASAPGMLVKESWAAYRTVPAITMVITTLFIFGVFTIFEKYNFQQTCYISLFLIIMIVTNNNIQAGFSTPQQIEYQVLRKEIINTIPRDYTGALYYIKPDNRSRPYFRSQKYDEFSAFSLGMDWTFKGMALMIKDKENMNYSIAANPIISEHTICFENCMVINISDK